MVSKDNKAIRSLLRGHGLFPAMVSKDNKAIRSLLRGIYSEM